MTLKNALGEVALDATLTDGTQQTQIVDAGGAVVDVTAASALKVDGSAVTQPVSGPLTDAQLRAAVVPVGDGGGSLTVDGTVAVSGSVAVTWPLTDAQLRASTVPVSGTVAISNPTTNPETGLAKDATLTDGTLVAVAKGAAASGDAAAGNPVLVGGSDGTNARTMLTDASGRQVVADGGLSLTTDPVESAYATGNITTSSTTLGSYSCAGYSTALITMRGTHAGINLTFEVSDNGTNWFGVLAARRDSLTAPSLTSGVITTNASVSYLIDITGWGYLRVRSTAYTSGTGVVGVTLTAATAAAVQTYSTNGTVAVTGYPTAAASADTLTNPTVTKIDATVLNYNGASWDRVRGNSTVNVDTSSARTATGNGTTAVNYNGKSLVVWVNVTAVSGTTPTCVFRLQWSPDNGTTWIDWDTTNLQTASITSATTAVLKAGPAGITTAANAAKADVVPRQVRLAWTIGGTSPSFTFASWFTFL